MASDGFPYPVDRPGNFSVGQECELRWGDEAGEFWRRVRVVEPCVYSDGTGVWVKHADNPGNNFPVPREDLRAIAEPAAAGVPVRGEEG